MRKSLKQNDHAKTTKGKSRALGCRETALNSIDGSQHFGAEDVLSTFEEVIAKEDAYKD